jgi:hypothetical protein
MEPYIIIRVNWLGYIEHHVHSGPKGALYYVNQIKRQILRPNFVQQTTSVDQEMWQYF